MCHKEHFNLPSCLIPRSNRLAFACLFICMLVSPSDASEFEKSQQKSAAKENEHQTPRTEQSFFNGEDLTGWKGDSAYWSVQDNAIVGHSDEPVEGNKFIWSEVPVDDFYLSLDVKLTPAERNAGIQFRSVSINERGQARGYQADAGGIFWGKLYHEHGRRKLDWNDRALEVIKQANWNHYEILAVGDRIWTAINGTLCVAIKDPQGERSGQIAFQIHGGPPQTVHYRNPTLTHNPQVKIAGMNEAELNAKLKAPDDANSKPVEHK